MKSNLLKNVQSINIEEIPSEFQSEVWSKLNTNGGNVINVYRDEEFGIWLKSVGFKFKHPRIKDAKKTWGWLVVFR